MITESTDCRRFVMMAAIGLAFAITSYGITEEKPSSHVERLTMKTGGLKLIKVRAGAYEMGLLSPEEFAAAQGEAADLQQLARLLVVAPPRIKVTVPKDFYLGQYEVTIGQFREFVKATNYKTVTERDGKGGTGRIGPAILDSGFGQSPQFNWSTYGFPVDDDFPVTNVCWRDAKAFCEWLSRVENRRFRLPREIEWEYACRAGSNGPFYFDGGFDETTQYANVADQSLITVMAGYQKPHPGDDGVAYLAKVGRYKANPWGFHDMLGNGAEWCEDDYRVVLTDHPAIVKLSAGLRGDGPEPRVIRGGHWFSRRLEVSSVLRPSTPAGKSTCMVGFRVVMEVD